MPRQKVRFSVKTLEKVPSRMYNVGNYSFEVQEAPGVTLSYFNIKRKAAVAKASKDAPGCTFVVREFSDQGQFKIPMEHIGYMSDKTLEHIQSRH